MKKKNIAIVGVILFLISLTVGYALFSETITITGTSTATGDFDVKFIDPGKKPTTSGYTNMGEEEIAVISPDGNTVTITVNKLDHPGAYVEIPVKVQNTGSISVVLEGLDESLFKVDPPMKISHTEIASTELASNATTEFTVKVEWDSADESPTRTVTSTFTLKLNYRQK